MDLALVYFLSSEEYIFKYKKNQQNIQLQVYII